MTTRLGVDTGGTFTDFVWLGPDNSWQVHKQLSTPNDPSVAILDGVGVVEAAPAELVAAPLHARGALHVVEGAAQQMVTDYSAQTGIEMVPQQEYGYDEATAQYFPLPKDASATGSKITSKGLQRRMVEGAELPDWFVWPDMVEELRLPLDDFAERFVYGTGIPEIYYSYRFEPRDEGGWTVSGEARR